MHEGAGALIFALLTALGAAVTVQLGSVPVTLQTLAVYTSGLFLRPAAAAASQILYLIAGLFLPVFASPGFGWEYIITRNTSGYLIAFPFTALIVSMLARRWTRFPATIAALEAGSVFLFLCGTLWMYAASDSGSWIDFAGKGWWNLLPYDQAKILAAALIHALLAGPASWLKRP